MELLDVVDDNNNLIGLSEDRKIVHEKNFWHRHVSCWIMNSKGKILLQKGLVIKLEILISGRKQEGMSQQERVFKMLYLGK